MPRQFRTPPSPWQTARKTRSKPKTEVEKVRRPTRCYSSCSRGLDRTGGGPFLRSRLDSDGIPRSSESIQSGIHRGALASLGEEASRNSRVKARDTWNDDISRRWASESLGGGTRLSRCAPPRRVVDSRRRCRRSVDSRPFFDALSRVSLTR